VEPFDVNCETCHARLRVREERFRGQIHPCPKCGSMVFIPAPVSPTDAAAQAAESVGAAQASAGVGLAARLAGFVGRHAVTWSICGAALVVTGSLAVSLVFNNGEEVAVRADKSATPSRTAAVEIADSVNATNVVKRQPAVTIAPAPTEAAMADTQRYDTTRAARPETNSTDSSAALPTLPALPANDASHAANNEPVAVDDHSARGAPPEAAASDPGPPDERKPDGKRMLHLDPLQVEPQYTSLGNVTQSAAADTTPSYSSQIDDDAIEADAKPRTSGNIRRPRNVAAQLTLRIQSIDVPAMTLVDFIRMVSEMAAVPIKLDAAAGVSPQTKVIVRGRDVTLGELLDDVLAQHGLVREERDGILVLNRHQPD
jgi:hypothetical protein